jgi:hypothetical protein
LKSRRAQTRVRATNTGRPIQGDHLEEEVEEVEGEVER